MGGFISIVGGRWVTYAVAMVTTAYITRILGPDNYAKYVQMLFIFGVFYTVFNLSIPSAVSRYVAEHASKGEMSRASGVLKTGLKTTIVAGIVASTIMILFSNQLATIVIGDSEAANLVKLLAISTGLTVVISPLISYVYGLQKFREYTLISIVSDSFWRGSLLVALLLGTGLYGLSFAWMVVSAVSSLALAILILRIAGKAEKYPLSQLFSYSMPLVASVYLGFLSQWMDSLLLPYFGTMRMLGLTNVAMTLVNTSLVMINSASTVLFTHFIRIDAISGREALIEAGEGISRLLSYCFIPFGFLVGATSDLLVLIYAGEGFSQAALLLKFLSPFVTASTVLFVIWANEVTATGNTRLLLLNTIIALASYFPLVIILIPWLGEAGYVLVRVLNSIIVFPYIWRKTKAKFPIRFDFRALFLSALVSMAIVLPTALVEITTSNHLLTLVTSVLGVGLYIFIVIKSGLLRKDEISLILRLITHYFNEISNRSRRILNL